MNKLTYIKYHAKRNYYENLIKTNNQNSSEIWSIMKEIIECKKNSTKSKLLTAFLIENQMVKTDSQVFLDNLCEYFANIEANMAKNVPPNIYSFKLFTNSCIQSFAFPQLCEEEVNFCIDNIKSGSAQGSDEIPLKFVKLSKCIISPLLTKLFNKCIKQESFPDSFKVAHVIPIPKVSTKAQNLLMIYALFLFFQLLRKYLKRFLKSK